MLKNPAARFRETIWLERKRAVEGLTPDELTLWTDLKRDLGREFSPDLTDKVSDQRKSVRLPVKLRVSFFSLGQLEESLMTNFSKGGLFIAARRPCEIGTRLEAPDSHRRDRRGDRGAV